MSVLLVMGSFNAKWNASLTRPMLLKSIRKWRVPRLKSKRTLVELVIDPYFTISGQVTKVKGSWHILCRGMKSHSVPLMVLWNPTRLMHRRCHAVNESNRSHNKSASLLIKHKIHVQQEKIQKNQHLQPKILLRFVKHTMI